MSRSKLKREDVISFYHRDIKTDPINFNKEGDEANSNTWFEKIRFVLLNEGQALTLREILNRLYEYFEDVNKADDRRNIISISAILSNKEKDGKIVKDKSSRNLTKFMLSENH